MIKAAFFDIDNTLYDWKHKQWVQSGLDAVKSLKEKGIKVFLASARPLHSQIQFGAFNLGIKWDGYISSAGAIAFTKGRYVKKDLMDKKDVYKIIALANKLGLTMEVVTPKSRYLSAPANQYLTSYHGTYTDITPPVRHYNGGPCTGVLLFSPEEFDEEFRQALPNLLYYRFHPSAVDVTPCEHLKGDAIAAILRYYGINDDEAISFGDDFQDISMKDHSLFVAMGNGKEEVKDSADYVTDPIWEDGVHNALIHLEVL